MLKHPKNLHLLALILGLLFVAKPSLQAEPIPSYPINNNVAYDLTYTDIQKKQFTATKSQEVNHPKPTQKPKPVVKLASSKENISPPKPTNQVTEIIKTYSEKYQVNTSVMVEIARCESNFRENAVNGPYAGIYQFTASTWQSNRQAMGEDPNPDLRFSAEEAAKTAAFKMARDGFNAWPACSRKALSLSN